MLRANLNTEACMADTAQAAPEQKAADTPPVV